MTSGSTARLPNAAAAGTVDLRRLLDSAFAGPAWHGPTLRSALRGVKADEALWRPAPGRNRIWELALHAAYAKHRVLVRLDHSASGRFPRRLDRQWWPRLPEEETDSAWQADLVLLEESHRALSEAVAALPSTRLAQSRPGVPFTLAEEVAGAALHDVYHAGQIRLVRRLYAGRGAGRRRGTRS